MADFEYSAAEMPFTASAVILLPLDAIQILVPAHEELLADQGWRRVDPLVELVGREHVEFTAVLEHERHAVAARDVNAAWPRRLARHRCSSSLAAAPAQ